MLTCYIAGALTNLGADDFLSLYERVGEVCQLSGFDAYLPHIVKRQATSMEITPKMVFSWDLERLRVSDLVIAFVGMPSLGVGIELGIAASLEIPVITYCPKHAIVSPMVLGHPNLQQHIWYECENELIEHLSESLVLFASSIRKGTCSLLIKKK